MNRTIIKIEGQDPYPDKCRGSTFDGWHHYRCANKGVITEVVNGTEMKFCRTHSTEHIEKINAKYRAKYEAKNASHNRATSIRDAFNAIADATLNADHSALPPEVQKAVLEYLKVKRG